MTIQSSYMGTKRLLAPHVAALLPKLKDGPFLDIFSGICSLTSALGTKRQVWSNDAQLFAASVGAALLTSRNSPDRAEDTAAATISLYLENLHALSENSRKDLSKEERLLSTEDWTQLREFQAELPYIGNCSALARERELLSRHPHEEPYRLFTITFPGTFFGLFQCMQIDSIRYAIDKRHTLGQIDFDEKRWLCLALCEAARKVSTSTGHFAQYLTIRSATSTRFVYQRRRSVWKEWLNALFDMAPLGTKRWRTGNRSFRSDAQALLETLRSQGATCNSPAVIYADPPYTEDQYSRYYHVYETLLLYDYPVANGKGRYRSDRFVSDFCLKSKVREAFLRLGSSCNELGATLIVSYPDNGVLKNASIELPKLLRGVFSQCRRVRSVEHFHSSMGSSKGYEKRPVNELLFIAS